MDLVVSDPLGGERSDARSQLEDALRRAGPHVELQVRMQAQATPLLAIELSGGSGDREAGANLVEAQTLVSKMRDLGEDAKVVGSEVARSAAAEGGRDQTLLDVETDGACIQPARLLELGQAESRFSGLHFCLPRSTCGAAGYNIRWRHSWEKGPGMVYFGLSGAALITAISLIWTKYVAKTKRARRDRGGYTFFAGVMLFVAVGAFALGYLSMS